MHADKHGGGCMPLYAWIEHSSEAAAIFHMGACRAQGCSRDKYNFSGQHWKPMQICARPPGCQQQGIQVCRHGPAEAHIQATAAVADRLMTHESIRVSRDRHVNPNPLLPLAVLSLRWLFPPAQRLVRKRETGLRSIMLLCVIRCRMSSGTAVKSDHPCLQLRQTCLLRRAQIDTPGSCLPFSILHIPLAIHVHSTRTCQAYRAAQPVQFSLQNTNRGAQEDT